MDYITLLTIICILPAGLHALSNEICEQKGEYLQCPQGKVLVINTVLYGRLKTGVCNPYQVPNLPTNCKSTSITTNTILKLCEYRGSCFLQADNNILGEDPCPNFPKYLDINYDCVIPTTTTNPNATKTTKPTTTPTTTSTSTTTTSTTTTSTTTRTTPTTTTRRTTTPTTTTRRTTTPTTTTRRTTTPTTTTRRTTTPTTTTSTTTRATTTTTQSPVVPFVPFNAPPGSQLCHDYLVSGKNGVKDGQLSASSVFQTGSYYDNHGPNRGRLFSDATKYPNGTYNRGAWSAGTDNQQQYIQVQLNAPSIVRGVATQGRHVNPNDLCCYQYVSKYKVMYSVDCMNFETVKDQNGNDKIFTGNADQDSVVTNMLPCPVMARCIRINPIDWKDHISLRFDLLGCTANTADVGHCPPGWIERPGSNQCYIITDINDMRTRDDASSECQKQQGHLVKIDSIAERDWIRQKVAYLQQTQGQFHFWTGLSNRPRTDNTGYRWDDHTPLDTNVLPWKQNQPDNGGGGTEHCGELWSGELNDNDCGQHYPYICEQSKFWKPPKNIPNVYNPVIPTTLAKILRTTTTTTTTTTKAPVTVKPYVRPQLPGSQVINGILYSGGCLNQTNDCSFKPAGDYQSCQGCHYYLTCAPSGVFSRPCPANLVWDDNIKTCQVLSSTCGPAYG
ncbi:Milk fat globule-EGF factor 8 protein [Mactra antiquata]